MGKQRREYAEMKTKLDMCTKTFFYICGMTVMLFLSGCSETEQTPDATTEQATFRVFTRADEQPLDSQEAWLYLAERKEESEQELTCLEAYDVSSGSYSLENRVSQWYKMAFVCVPKNKGILPVETPVDFNDIVLDYTSVLQSNLQGADDDLAIYRKVIDRWLIPGEVLEEEVVLNRITGQLVLDMGILKDQFPNKVTEITVTLTDVPTKVYLRDNSNDEVIYPADALSDFSYTFENPNWGDDGKHFCMYFNLLPFTVVGAKQVADDGTVTVSGCRVCVEYNGGEEVYPIGTNDPIDSGIQIRKNIRTTVYFNGMEDGEFEVRYAGFNDSSIGVADDEWNGWKETETNP